MQIKVPFLSLVLISMVLACVNTAVGQEKAHDFTLTDIDGNPFSLSDCSAKVVLIDFFGTQCVPCIEVIPALRNLYGEYSHDQLEIISISSESEAVLRDFAQVQNMVWIVASDPGGQVNSEYGVQYIPTLVMVDADGYIGHKHIGDPGESTLRSEIDSLLSGGENGDSDGGEPWISIELVGIIGVAVVCFLIIGIVVAGQALEWSKPAKKRGKEKR